MEGVTFSGTRATLKGAAAANVPVVCASDNGTVDEQQSPLSSWSSPRLAASTPAERQGPKLRCTIWPAGSDGLPDAARCAHGDKLQDGYKYFHNSGRGTRHAVCGEKAACTCCRRPTLVPEL